MIQTAREIWRDYETDGVPASGNNEVDKRAAREWGTNLETVIAGEGATLGFATFAIINADLAHAANTLAVVYADTTPANNGTYVKVGGSGSGSWSRIGDVPGDIIELTVTGGTANAITASAAEIPTTAGSKLYLITPTANNTGAATIAIPGFMGGAAIPIKNAFNATLASGSLLASNRSLMSWSVDHFQLLIAANVDASAILADAQAAAVTSTSEAAAAAATAASVSVTVGGFGIATYDAAVAGAAIDSGVHFVQLWGRSNPLDGGQVTAVDVGLSDPGGPSRAKWKAPDNRWFQFKTDVVRPEMFGEFGGASTSDPDNSVGLIQMFDFVNSFKNRKILMGPGLWCLDSALPAIACLTELECPLGGSQPPIFIKRYVEIGSFNGVIRSEQYGLRASGVNIVGISGSGGAGISSILTSNSPNVGESYLDDIHISMGAAANLSLYYDGDTNTTPGTEGYRGIFLRGHNLFGAAQGCAFFTGVHHILASNFMAQTAGGASPNALVATALSSSHKADDINISGVLAGDVALTNIGRGSLYASLINNFSADSSVSGIRLYGSPGGTRTLGWTGSNIIE